MQGRKSRRPPEDIERIVRANVAPGLIGKDFRVTKMQGRWLDSELAEKTMGTIHPSAILRAPDPEVRERQYREFVGDLTLVAREIVH